MHLVEHENEYIRIECAYSNGIDSSLCFFFVCFSFCYCKFRMGAVVCLHRPSDASLEWRTKRKKNGTKKQYQTNHPDVKVNKWSSQSHGYMHCITSQDPLKWPNKNCLMCIKFQYLLYPKFSTMHNQFFVYSIPFRLGSIDILLLHTNRTHTHQKLFRQTYVEQTTFWDMFGCTNIRWTSFRWATLLFHMQFDFVDFSSHSKECRHIATKPLSIALELPPSFRVDEFRGSWKAMFLLEFPMK